MTKYNNNQKNKKINMISTKVLLVSALCLFGIVAAQETFKDCLQKDSISCVQLAVRQYMD